MKSARADEDVTALQEAVVSLEHKLAAATKHIIDLEMQLRHYRDLHLAIQDWQADCERWLDSQ